MTELVSEDATSGGGTTLTISDCSSILGDANLGDSIGVNGTCLTITEFDAKYFKVGIAPETLRRTNLGSLAQGQRVNLERALSATTRMGGHFVQGHVDTVATIVSVAPDGEALTFRFTPKDRRVLRYVVEKGYVTLDGASLTITAVDDTQGWWEVMLIAYTQERLVTAAKRAGDEVNVEVDMVGKYVEKSVQAYLGGLEQGQTTGMIEKIFARLVEQKMVASGRHGH